PVYPFQSFVRSRRPSQPGPRHPGGARRRQRRERLRPGRQPAGSAHWCFRWHGSGCCSVGRRRSVRRPGRRCSSCLRRSGRG
ncbi:hypothetical protein CJT77_31970, partial [Pseudomonas aeruginosa]